MPKLRCKTLDPSRHALPRFAQVKLDGLWLEISRHDDGLYCLTSHPTDITAKLLWHPAIPEFARFLGATGDAAYCELWVPGRPRSDVKTAINEEWSELCIAPHAVSETVLPTDAPLSSVNWLLNSVSALVDPPPFWETLGDVGLDMNCARGHCKDAEGVVYKSGNLTDWYKWKPVRTVDLIVTGIKDGNGKYDLLVGALVCALADGRVVASCSGMSDEQRLEMSEQRASLAGRVCEVAYQHVGPRGRLVHPRFVQWRDDKRSEECTADQDADWGDSTT